MAEKDVTTRLPELVKLQERIAATLAFVAGYIDGYGWISYSTYLSFMSGNTTQTGCMTGLTHFADALPSGIAIIFFVIGLILGNVLIYSPLPQSRRLLFSLVAAVLALIIIFMQVNFKMAELHIALISMAMGAMNTTFGQIGAQSLNITFITGTLTAMARHVALALKQRTIPNAYGPWDTHWTRASLLAEIWGVFLLGALLSGMVVLHLGKWALLPPLLILLILVIYYPRIDKAFTYP